ncbi:MAG TPA: hypothetical protein VM165_09260 [Planctomycetaceae bacterium]|nr:hypothetical protein [Planctomycetaceae bacterium]
MRWFVGSRPHPSEQRHRGLVLAGLCAWLATVVTGMGVLAGYTNQAGSPAAPPDSVAALATFSPHKHRLLMFAHPHCPCTAASLSELARLMSRCTGIVDATVYFYRPENKPESWVAGNLWNSAAAIPGVQVLVDPQGRTAAQFGSTTSGDVLLYDPTGQLCFQGGITPGRGHEGDNQGKSTVISIVLGDRVNVDRSPVFGCTLRPASTPCRE